MTVFVHLLWLVAPNVPHLVVNITLPDAINTQKARQRLASDSHPGRPHGLHYINENI